jgi:triosephosphate isomerase
MDRRYFIANLKSHFTIPEIEKYLVELQSQLNTVDIQQNCIIICPSFTLLDFTVKKSKELNLPIQIGAQNVSGFEAGAYTGEVFAEQVKEFAEYVIIGHSERKRYNHESEDDILKKAEQAKRVGLKIIQCVQDESSIVSEYAEIVAYEPPSAISTFGTGIPDSPEDVKRVLDQLDFTYPGKILTYGGSVKQNTIKNYSGIEKCKGFLIGGASLNASEFLTLPNSC